MCKMYLNCVILLLITLTFGIEITHSMSYRSNRPRSLCIYPYVENGKPRLRNSGQLVRFSCQPQFTLIGTKFASCRNGRWDTPLPVCARSGCPPLKVPNSLAIPIHDSALVIFFCLPRYKMVGDSNVVYCNGSSWNGTAPSCVDESSTSLPSLSCDFESANLCGWVQDELHDFDWRRWSGRTPSSFVQTGPKYDHTLGESRDGHYMYIESSSRQVNDKARLISPVYDAGLAGDGCFSFFYHMYGRNVGSLRVYQKPDNVSLEMVLNSTYSSEYLLFDVSGNMGDQWYQSVTPLKNFNDSFQIIFEGVRGNGFSSDIAIDDVAILTGENCTKTWNEALSPFPILVDSCAGRCDTFGNESRLPASCGCSIACVAEENSNCCHDYEDLCAFAETTTSSEMAPRTEKLVASTTHQNINSTTTKKHSQNTTTTTTKTTTTATVSSTQHRVTVPTTTHTTTRKPTTARATTTRRPATTTAKRVPTTIKHTTRRTVPTTTKQTTVPTRVQPTKKPLTTVTTTQLTTVTTTQSTTKMTTIEPVTTARVTVPEKVTSQSAGRNTELLDGLTKDEHKSAKANGSAGLVTGIILVVLVCCGAGYLVVKSRSSEGRLMLAKLRGRTRCDPEVRYITAEEDE